MHPLPLVGGSLTSCLPDCKLQQSAPLASTPPTCHEPVLAQSACVGPAEANAQLSGILLKVVENKPGLHHLLVSSAWGTCGMPGSTRLGTSACPCTRPARWRLVTLRLLHAPGNWVPTVLLLMQVCTLCSCYPISVLGMAPSWWALQMHASCLPAKSTARFVLPALDASLAMTLCLWGLLSVTHVLPVVA